MVGVDFVSGPRVESKKDIGFVFPNFAGDVTTQVFAVVEAHVGVVEIDGVGDAEGFIGGVLFGAAEFGEFLRGNITRVRAAGVIRADDVADGGALFDPRCDGASAVEVGVVRVSGDRHNALIFEVHISTSVGCVLTQRRKGSKGENNGRIPPLIRPGHNDVVIISCTTRENIVHGARWKCGVMSRRLSPQLLLRLRRGEAFSASKQKDIALRHGALERTAAAGFRFLRPEVRPDNMRVVRVEPPPVFDFRDRREGEDREVGEEMRRGGCPELRLEHFLDPFRFFLHALVGSEPFDCGEREPVRFAPFHCGCITFSHYRAAVLIIRRGKPADHRFADAQDGRPELAVLAYERVAEGFFPLLRREVRVPEPQFALSVPFLVREVFTQQPFLLVIEVERRLRERAEFHELREVGVHADREIDVFVDCLFVVVLEEKDVRAEHEYSVASQLLDQGADVDALRLLEEVFLRLDADPDVVDAEAQHVVHAEGGDRLRGREDAEVERAVVADHQIEQLHRAVFLEQEVLVHYEEVVSVQFFAEADAGFVQLASGFQEGMVFPVVEMGCTAEAASVGAAHAGHQHGAVLGERQSERPLVVGGGHCRVRDRGVHVLLEQFPERANPFAAHNNVAVDQLFDVRYARAVPAEYDFCSRRYLAHDLRHLLRFDKVRSDKRNADVLVSFFNFLAELLQRREIEHHRRHLEVFGDEVEAETAVVVPDRENSLFAGDLIVKEFEFIFLAAVFVVHTERPEN